MRTANPGKHPTCRAWRKKQYEILLPLLGEGKCEQAVAHLHSLRTRMADAPVPLEDAIRYLETQRDWLSNDKQWREQGYPVGSGAPSQWSPIRA